jgi:hypothetical protein
MTALWAVFTVFFDPRDDDAPASSGCRSASTVSRAELGELVQEEDAVVPECWRMFLGSTDQGTPGRRGASTTGSGACHTASTLF